MLVGSDMTLWLEHFDTEIDEFDLNKMRFSILQQTLVGSALMFTRKNHSYNPRMLSLILLPPPLPHLSISISVNLTLATSTLITEMMYRHFIQN
jgi:hypothetical protein